MKSYLESSKLYRFLFHLSHTYKLSHLQVFVETIKKWHANSFVHQIALYYLERKSKAEYTFTYKILCAIGKKADVVGRRIQGFLSSNGSTSISFSLFDDLKAQCTQGINLLILTGIVTFIVGYSLVITIRGIWSMSVLLQVVLLGVLGVVVFTTLGKWKQWIKNSIFYKLCQTIWE